jgi:hypothetical protein
MSPRTQENAKKPKKASSPAKTKNKAAVKKPASKKAAAAPAKETKQFPKESAIARASKAGKAAFYATIDLVTGQPLPAPNDWHLPAW